MTDLALAEQVAVPDSYFWYTLSLLLAVALIGIIWRFAERISKTLDELKGISKVHENIVENHHERLTRIEDVMFLVKYPKEKQQ